MFHCTQKHAPMYRIFIVTLIFCSLSASVFGQLRMSHIYSNNMMLQCNTAVPIKGHGKPSSTVKLLFNGKNYTDKVQSDGSWKIILPPAKPGFITNIEVINGDERIQLENVIFGDIWLCGGQSNMEWFLSATENADAEIQSAQYPNLRIVDVPHRMEASEQKDFAAPLLWSSGTPASVAQFSAVGYYFGKQLMHALDIPIGLINNNYGGTVVEAWTSGTGLQGLPVYEKKVRKLETINFEKEKNEGTNAHNKWMANFYQKDQGIIDSIYAWANPIMDRTNWKKINLPGYWEASSDSTLRDLDGVVWLYKKIKFEGDASAGKISMGAIDDSDMIWINGESVGSTFNRYNKDRVYDIKKNILHHGENIIIIRVEDYIGGGGVTGSSSKLFIQQGDLITRLDGTWQYKIGMRSTEKMPSSSFSPNHYPTCLYNGMIAPMADFPIKGVIWYQGESNTYRAFEYRDLFKRFILDWRSRFNHPDLPFLYVQLANYYPEDSIPGESQWAELREAQEKALCLLNTSMVTAIDIGEANNIHPINKYEVGRRLALAALADVYYQQQVIYLSPSYDSHTIKDNAVFIKLKNEYNGLKTTDKFGYIFGFSIAGDDQIFRWAKAEIIDKNIIKVWSDKVKSPKVVRYAWQNNPSPANLFNSHDFPALPFRTDDWKLSTQDIRLTDE